MSTLPKIRRKTPSLTSASGSLLRGLKVLEVLLRASVPMALSDIVTEVDFDASTVHRLLVTLVEQSYVLRDEGSKTYMPGPRALSPLSLFHPVKQLSREARPVLQLLRDRTGETAALVVYLGYERLVVEFARGSHPLTPYYDTWLKSPLHGSATGKLLLASISPEERQFLMGPEPYVAHTQKTLTDSTALNRELDATNERGYALARDDAFTGLTALGVALNIAGGSRLMGCLTITAESRSVPPEREQEIGLALKEAATLLVSTAPSINIFRHWNIRARDRPS